VADSEATVNSREAREPAADEEMSMMMSEEHTMVSNYSVMAHRDSVPDMVDRVRVNGPGVPSTHVVAWPGMMGGNSQRRRGAQDTQGGRDGGRGQNVAKHGVSSSVTFRWMTSEILTVTELSRTAEPQLRR
jgi:hypothetical protein